MRRRSLRTLLLAGLVALNAAVTFGIAGLVWARARSESHEALNEELRLRAKTFAGLLEIDPDGHEFELPPKMVPEYATSGSGAYAAIYDPSGKAIVRSPSLGAQDLATPGAWTAGEFRFDERDPGPDGIPCAAVTHSFVVRLEHDKPGEADWTPPSEEARRYRIVVAADSRPRDESLRSLALFLAGTCAGSLLVTLAGGLVVARFVLAPLRTMTQEAAALDPSDTSRRLEPAAVVSELESLARTLNSALDRLGDAIERQKRFASDASHELRTPLAVLLGNAELLLRRERTGEDYRRGLERQRRVAQRMTRLTEDLLFLARADGGCQRVERSRVSLAEAARSVCDEFAALAEEAGVELACHADDAVVATGDRAHLEAMLQNLVGNALKFTPRGGCVTVGVRAEGGDAVIGVEDTGPGIPAEHHARIFERFHRVGEGKDAREGAGLGLSIVAWIVRAHGGRVEVRSEPGRGAVFTVRIPRAAGDPSARTEKARTAATSG